MNRRDTAIIAHLDAMESRMAVLFATVTTRLDTIVDAIADLHAHINDPHAHNGGES